jgi:hypothetical protein
MLKRLSLLALILVVAMLAACTRSASSGDEGDATEDPIQSIFSTVATQTALAAEDGVGGGEGDTEDDSDSDLPATSTPTEMAEASPTTEPTATTTPAPTPETSVPTSYTLHEGEWPYCLSRRFDIDPAALLTANGLTEGEADNLSVGTTLTIPTDQVGTFGEARALRSHPTTYTASGTDTWYSIACQFGDVYPEAIAGANGRELDDELTGGEQIHIP